MYYNTSAGNPALPDTLFNNPHNPDTVPETVSDTVPDTLQDVQPDTVPDAVPTRDGSKLSDLADVIEFCKRHSLPGEVVGRWVWIRFPEKPDVETRELLKSAGFRWVKIRGQWAHSCGYPCRKGSGNPRYKYGSIPVSAITRDDIKVLKGVPA